jgi:hypothetical protein
MNNLALALVLMLTVALAVAAFYVAATPHDGDSQPPASL